MEGKAYLDRMTLVCGGQTGVDRAMLDFCLDHGLNCGGWCPGGRLAEDGTLAAKYPVRELPGASFDERTLANVRDSDATVVIYYRELQGGTLLSSEKAREEHKPLLLLDLHTLDPETAAAWLSRFAGRFRPRRLNISGPRASEWPEGYDRCYTLLKLCYGIK
jgi:hypothetical protein